jgi:acetyl-CoA synthetase
MSQPCADDFRAARDLLLELREDHDAARARFRWPRPERFNYARDWFDAVAAGPAGEREALVILGPDADEQRLTFAALAARSRRLAGSPAGSTRRACDAATAYW